MSNNFDWITEEDHPEWDKLPDDQPDPSPRRRRWLFFLIALVVLSFAGFGILRQVNERIAESEEQVKADVLAVNALVRQAARDSDRELLTSMLSGREAAWTNTQQQLLEADLMFGSAGSPMGLRALASEPLSTTVTLSSNLREAYVTERHGYAVTNAAGVTETITLDQNHVFREGERRWLYSPPGDDFWGDWNTYTGGMTTLAYRARDERFAIRFASDIDNKLAELCDFYECPSDLLVNIRFDPEPDSVLHLSRPTARLEPTRSVNLPSPTLIGTPTTMPARSPCREHIRPWSSRPSPAISLSGNVVTRLLFTKPRWTVFWPNSICSRIPLRRKTF